MKTNFVVDYKLTLIASIAVLSLGGIAAVTILTFQGADLARIGVITAFLAPTIVSLLALIRSETNAKDVGEANKNIMGVIENVDGHLEEHTQVTRLALQALKEANPPVEKGAIEASDILAKELPQNG